MFNNQERELQKNGRGRSDRASTNPNISPHPSPEVAEHPTKLSARSCEAKQIFTVNLKISVCTFFLSVLPYLHCGSPWTRPCQDGCHGDRINSSFAVFPRSFLTKIPAVHDFAQCWSTIAGKRTAAFYTSGWNQRFDLEMICPRLI